MPIDKDDKNTSRERAEKLFREFLARREADDEVTADEYFAKHPELEHELKELFSTLKTDETEEIDLGEGKAPASGPAKDRETIGDFRIIREIGSGGMGTVYEAEQLSLKRRVALKVLPSHLSFSDQAVCKFQREAEAGGRQQHAGIVGVIAVGEEEGVHYIAQELIKGGFTLADRLGDLGRGKRATCARQQGLQRRSRTRCSTRTPQA